MQQKWITKLLGYSFVIDYKKGKENVVGDALSRKFGSEELAKQQELSEAVSCLFCIDFQDDTNNSLFLISFPNPTWIEELKASYQVDAEVQQILQSIVGSSEATGKFSLQNGLLLYKGKIYLGRNCSLKSKVLSLAHDSPLGGHSSYLKTFHRAKRDWFWWGMKQDLKDYIKSCDICQRIKH